MEWGGLGVLYQGFQGATGRFEAGSSVLWLAEQLCISIDSIQENTGHIVGT